MSEASTVDDIKQVIIIRKDLKMRRGKEIAQGAHASMEFLRVDPKKFNEPIVEKWLDGLHKKVVLQIDDEVKMNLIHVFARSAGVYSHIVYDQGLTEFKGVETATAMAIGPDYSDLIDTITGANGVYPLSLY